MLKLIKNALIAGTVPAILEALLILSVEPSINLWVLAQAVLFWFTCGAIICLIQNEWPMVISSILLTVFLNLPWYIAESVIKNKPEHLLPLIVASIIQGAIIGILKKKLNKKTGVA